MFLNKYYTNFMTLLVCHVGVHWLPSFKEDDRELLFFVFIVDAPSIPTFLALMTVVSKLNQSGELQQRPSKIATDCLIRCLKRFLSVNWFSNMLYKVENEYCF